jgi:hypothetical protein
LLLGAPMLILALTIIPWVRQHKHVEAWMKHCEVCGNQYDKLLEIKKDGIVHLLDSFECAIHLLAPRCSHCQCPIIGHGMEADEKMFCCASCARESGEKQMTDRTTHIQKTAWI